ncbi:hypothetical protein WDW86_07985 [Bdellovibrionota bacterium FG-2]
MLVDRKSDTEQAGLYQPQFFFDAPAVLPDLAFIGEKMWDLVVNHTKAPGVDFEKKKAQVLPIGITNPMVLQPWNDPISSLH